mmetsp:Transcript_16135/g.35740  ORF Transcript_16135/g.35740 Transcript_16135/m.35740 type:complete len:809 (-) Transcript_16135:1244-3670(-)
MADAGESGVLASILTVVGLAACLFLGLWALIVLSRFWKASVRAKLLKALKRRRNDKDGFREEHGYSWDYVLVFKVYEEEQYVSNAQAEFSMRHVLQRLSKGGMEVRLFYSLQRQHVFCKVRCSLARLQKHADLIDYTLQFDPAELKKTCRAGTVFWEPLTMPDVSESTHLAPFDHIFGRYDFDEDTQRTKGSLINLYKKWPRLRLAPDELAELGDQGLGLNRSPARNPMIGRTDTMDESSAIELQDVGAREEGDATTMSKVEEATIFRGVDRLKLMHMIINSRGPGACGLDIRKLLDDKCLLAYMPLHDMVELRALESNWLTFFSFPWSQPCDQVKDYFGEKIGLYFKWLGLYCTWLFVAALLGFGFWFSVATNDNNPSTSSVPYFAGIMALWSVFFLEHWKRTENNTSMKWGMTGFEKQEQVRVQFQGETILSPVDGKPELYFPTGVRKRRQYWSSAVINSMCLIVVGVVACIFALRIAIRTTNAELGGVQLASVVASVLLALQVQILNGYFGNVALELNQAENHRTDTEFEDSMIIKLFLFQFVNSYASFYYLAFAAEWIGECHGDGCMKTLSLNVGVIYGVNLFFGNFLELLLPYLSYRYKYKKESEASKDDMSVPEREYLLDKYDAMSASLADYAEVAINYGYLALFVSALPMAAFFALVVVFWEIRADCWKLLNLYQRPFPKGCEDIGTWQDIFLLISIFSVVTNAGLIAFTMTVLDDQVPKVRFWVFIGFQWFCFSMQFLIMEVIPDIPEEVVIQQARTEFIDRKLIDLVADDVIHNPELSDFELVIHKIVDEASETMSPIR